MSGRKGRLDKLCSALTARERAILVLRAWKEGQDEDPQLRRTMPLDQVISFNAYIDLMHGISDLAPYILVLQQEVAQLGLRSAWLSTFDLWRLSAYTLAEYISFHTKEPITESEHKRQVKKARAKMAAVAELAEVLAERYDGWTEDELEPAGDDDEPVVTDKAWNRVLAQKKKELARLVGQGELEGKRKGRGVLVNVGSFYDWLGEPVPVLPEWGTEFEVFPDDEADEVDRLRLGRSHTQEVLLRGPSDPLLRLLAGTDADDEKPGKGNQHRINEAVDALCMTLRDNVPLLWQEVQAVETVIEELAAEFDGEDPLDPFLRDALDKAKQELQDLIEKVQTRVGALDLPEPGDALLAKLRALAKLTDQA